MKGCVADGKLNAFTKRFTILPNIHPFMHSFSHSDCQLVCSGAVRMMSRAQGHLDFQLGGAGDQLVTSCNQPTSSTS